MREYKIFDFHCDLLGYLALSQQNTPFDEQSFCSFPQLQKGNIKTQVMAFFANPTNQELKDYNSQLQQFLALKQKTKNSLLPLRDYKNHLTTAEILIIPAIENINLLFLNKEKLPVGIKRLEQFTEQVGKPFYAILVWKDENDFAGAFNTKIGLKEKGKYLVHHLIQKDIPIDLSHASDFLIEDLFNFIETENPGHPILASHSNFRRFADHTRNLNDEFVSEIVTRNGIIGINAMSDLIGGASLEKIATHLEYGLINFPNNIALGLDFFSKQCLPKNYVLKYKQLFPEGLENASKAQIIFQDLQKKDYPEKHLQKLAWQNGANFFEKIYKKKLIAD